MREMSAKELDTVSGSGFLADLGGAIAEAVCNLSTRGLKGVAACAAVGALTTELLNSDLAPQGAYACAKVGVCTQ